MVGHWGVFGAHGWFRWIEEDRGGWCGLNEPLFMQIREVAENRCIIIL
jgi:hypothetical protein